MRFLKYLIKTVANYMTGANLEQNFGDEYISPM